MTHFDERIGSTANVHGRYIIGFYYFDQKCLRAKIVWKWKFYCSKAICLLLLFLNKKNQSHMISNWNDSILKRFNRFKAGLRGKSRVFCVGLFIQYPVSFQKSMLLQLLIFQRNRHLLDLELGLAGVRYFVSHLPHLYFVFFSLCEYCK